MKPRAKAKSGYRRDKISEQQLEIFKMAQEARYELAMQAYRAQDDQTKSALDLLVLRLRSLSTGQIRIFPDGKQQPGVVVPIEPVQVDQNLLFLATEIFRDLAFFDVKVANYEFPSVYCAECGEKLTPTRKAKAKAKVRSK